MLSEESRHLLRPESSFLTTSHGSSLKGEATQDLGHTEPVLRLRQYPLVKSYKLHLALACELDGIEPLNKIRGQVAIRNSTISDAPAVELHLEELEVLEAIVPIGEAAKNLPVGTSKVCGDIQGANVPIEVARRVPHPRRHRGSVYNLLPLVEH